MQYAASVEDVAEQQISWKVWSVHVYLKILGMQVRLLMSFYA